MRLLFSSASLFILTVLLLSFPSRMQAQTILVQPYLQNATESSIVVMWETNTNTETKLQYGTTTNLDLSSSGSTITTLGGTILHTVTLTSLTPGTRYYYKAITGSWQSAIYDFVTPPLRNSEAPLNIVLMSDMQKDGGNPNIFSNLVNTSLIPYVISTYGSPLNDHVQMAVLPGDVVDNGNTYLQYKNDFFNPAQALWSYIPNYPAIGNHELNSANYFNYFNLPANGTPGYTEHWYSHDYSNVRVLSFDTNPTYRIPAQLAWLDSMLEVSCADPLIDFVFAQMHHPFKSELWLPGEADYTGEIVERLEAFSDSCGKPTIHFFGHTHAYSRGQSMEHKHLWVNVAVAGGNIDYWGEFANADYDEYIVSQDEYGFVMVEVTAGADPKFTLKRLSFGDQYNPGGNTQTDIITVHRYNTAPKTPIALYPGFGQTVSSFCTAMKADGFSDPNGEEHGSSQWQVSTDSANFNAPVFESWKQYANWYYEVNLQANDDLTDEVANNLPAGSTLWWRVRYRDKGLSWSTWSTPMRFKTSPLDTLTGNLVQNSGGESGITGWTATTGVIESLTAGQCAGISPYSGQKYFAVGALCVEYPFASAYQDINVAAYASSIDSGNVVVHYGAYMSDYANQDEPWFALQFLNAGGNVISSTDTIKHKTNVWTLKQKGIPVPANTRTIKYILMGKRFSGVDNDSYFDQVFLELLEGDLACSVYESPGPANGRIYVDPDAIGFPDGESWTTAYRSLGDALLQSNADTSIHEIWLAGNTYKVTSTSARDTAFHITRGVNIFGGFSGQENFLSERNVIGNPTLLSGETGNPAIFSDNTYHVIQIENLQDTLRLDGLKICCGYADGINEDEGGGIHVDVSSQAPVVVFNCMLENNTAEEGNSVYNAGKILLQECNISDHEIIGLTGSSIFNTGGTAELTLFNTAITQICQSCQEVIRNVNGAKLTVDQSSTLLKQ